MEASSNVAESGGGSSHFSSKLRLSSLKHVSLYDWWLIRTETSSGDQGLGVGGLISDQQWGLRHFGSAAILKRHSSDVLEAFDGITITVVGSINRARTMDNGFSSEVSSHFLFGFPYYWEEYARQSLADGTIYRADNPNSFVPKSIHDLPRSMMPDFAFSSCQVSGVCELQKSILGNIERTCCGNARYDAYLVPPKEGNGQVTSRDSQKHKISIKKSDVVRQHKIKDSVSIAQLSVESFQTITSEEDMGVDTDKSGWRPSTRSMSRFNMEGTQQEKNFLSSSLIKRPLSKSVSISDAPRRQHGESANEENTPNLNLKAGKVTLRSHSTRTVSHLKTDGTQKEENVLSSSLKNCLIKSVPASDTPKEKCGGSVGGKNVSVACMTTRKLALRSRSVDMHIIGSS